MANKRTCLCCRTQYHYCSQNCDDKNLPLWYNLFHNQNCHDIWYVLSDFENGVLSKEEAQEKIKSLDTSVIKNDAVMTSYNKLMEGPKVEKNTDSSPTPVEAPRPEKPLSVSEELKAEAKKSSAGAKKTRTVKKIEMPIGE